MKKLTPGRLLLLVCVAAVYFGAGKLGLKLAIVNASATAVWPATGIAIAAMLIFGIDIWPAILVAAFAVNFTTTGAAGSSLGIAAGNTAEAALGAYLTMRFARGRSAFTRAEDIFKFTVLAGMLATAVSATMGVASLRLERLVAPGEEASTWVTWWLGDMVGAVVMAPCIVLWTIRPALRRSTREIVHGLTAVAVLMAGGFILFGGFPVLRVPNGAFAFLCVPLVVWAGFHLRQHEMATAIVALAGIAIWGALRSRADFIAKAPLNESLLVLQIFIAAVAVMALVLSAVVAERRGYETALETAKNELEVKVEKRTEQLAERIRKQQRTEENLRQLSATLLGAQDEERRRIARDLHDSTGQLLTALAINLTIVGDGARGTSPQVDKKVAESIAMAKEISQEVRTISYLLHPPALDEMGLATALRWYVDGFEGRSKIRVSLAVPEDSERLERDLETMLFRVVQECLTNIHRHSGAKAAAIRMERAENQVKLVVEDQGHGISAEAMERITGMGSAGVGLRGMRERVNQFGGEIEISSNSNGTRIEVTVPARAV